MPQHLSTGRLGYGGGLSRGMDPVDPQLMDHIQACGYRRPTLIIILYTHVSMGFLMFHWEFSPPQA